MVAGIIHQRPDEDKLVGHAGDARKHLADVDAGNVSMNWVEFAANLTRSINFDVPHVLMWRPAGQEDVDDSLMAGELSTLESAP